eukprot:TRINITY_DN22450_c0_g1_i1.p1 TRINITY_DN22450_c0_g1~~TRINITY_DN22450_c0_g1_i1.p1  ORF type:complete len:296 (+),score=64.31 TRINITY_DN22450_c0_g1_i1:91-978(+)
MDDGHWGGEPAPGQPMTGEAKQNLSALIHKYANMEDQALRVEEMMGELGDLEDRELSRNARLREQLHTLQIANERKATDTSERNKALQARTLESLFQRQTDTLAKVIGDALSPLSQQHQRHASTSASQTFGGAPSLGTLPVHAYPYGAPASPPPPLPFPSPARDVEDAFRRAHAAEAMVEVMKKEVLDSRAQAHMLSAELQRLAEARAHDQRAPARVHAVEGTGAEARLKAMLAEFVDRPPGRAARQPASPAEAQLREQNKRLMAELMERDAKDQMMTQQLREIATRSSVRRQYP